MMAVSARSFPWGPLMHALVSHVTAVLFVAHLVLGCCWHHAHGLVTGENFATSVHRHRVVDLALCPHAHDHDHADHHGHDDDHDAPCDHDSPCGPCASDHYFMATLSRILLPESTCQWIKVRATATPHHMTLAGTDTPLCRDGHLTDRGSALPVRPHLLLETLLL